MSNIKDLTIYQRIYDLVLYSFPIINRFPKHQRFVLGQQIENSMLNLSQLIAQANSQKDKKETLVKTDIELEKLKLLVRLAKDLKFFRTIDHYENHSKRIDEIGRLLGGWMKRFT